MLDRRMQPHKEIAALELWCAYPADLMDPDAARACAALLSEGELARARRFRFERHRLEYLATHALARTALAHNHTFQPADWRFSENAYGKPAVDPGCGLHFNVSNSEGLVVCLVARGPAVDPESKIDVGVDVEPFSRSAEIAALAPRVFSATEQAQLESLADAQRLERALSLWVLKEAYIKARGLGLSLPLKKFSFVFDAEEARLEMDPVLDDTPARWRFSLLDFAQHRIALMVDTATAPLEIWEARPPQARARKLPASSSPWFPRDG